MTLPKDFQPNMIRFDGILYENLLFEPLDGWETERVAHRPAIGDGEFVLELLNDKGGAIVDVSPEVDFSSGCTSLSDGMRSVRVNAYLPLHPDARSVVFRRREHMIYKRQLSAQPPSVKITAVKPAGRQGSRRFALSWEAAHPEEMPLRFRIVYLTASGRGFPVSRMMEDGRQFTVDLGNLPGGKGSRFGILATDGARSAVAVSGTIDVSDVPPQLFVVTPSDNEVLPVGQPVRLCGKAFDAAGASLPVKHLIWEIDGEPVAEGVCQAIGFVSKPGKHRVTLIYAPNGKPLAGQAVDFKIGKQNKQNEAYGAFVAKLEAESKRIP